MIASNEKNKKGVRQLASEILFKVDTRKAYADVLLDHSLKDMALSDRDRALLTELAYGTLRWRGKIDARLNLYLRSSLEDTDPFIRNLLRVSFYQLVFLDKVPDYAAVNEAVRLAKAHGGGKVAGFVNAVLRNFPALSPSATMPIRRAMSSSKCWLIARKARFLSSRRFSSGRRRTAVPWKWS